VGINSFNGKNGNGTDPHIVFQFQNCIVQRRLNVSASNAGGYTNTEVRKYLTTVEGTSASGKFIEGLAAAGVPQGVLWAPVRVTGTGAATVTSTDFVWLPTAGEIGATSAGNTIAGTGETAGNQARFGYYDSWAERKKVNGTGTAVSWALATVDASDGSAFAAMFNNNDVLTSVTASVTQWLAPAFCVR
jgi:hypothetical protein